MFNYHHELQNNEQEDFYTQLRNQFQSLSTAGRSELNNLVRVSNQQDGDFYTQLGHQISNLTAAEKVKLNNIIEGPNTEPQETSDNNDNQILQFN